MKKFILLYIGGEDPKTEEEGKELMQQWNSWFDTLGKDVVVMAGFPFEKDCRAMDSNGKICEEDITKTTGFSILQAENIDAAVVLAKSCPHLKWKGSIEIKEEMPTM